MKKGMNKMYAEEYIEYIRNCRNELRRKFKIEPIYTYAIVLSKSEIKNYTDWISSYKPIFCHPEDEGLDYIEDFKFPCREL